MPDDTQMFGFSWQESTAISPRIISAMYHTSKATGSGRRISHKFWVLDYSRTPFGWTRVGSPKSPWLERFPAIAHLYPPDTPYWEDSRKAINGVKGAYIIFDGGKEAGLYNCIPKGQCFARIADSGGGILNLLHAAAMAGSEKGSAGFWDAQAALCGLIRLLHRLVPGPKGSDLVIGPDTTATATAFVKAVDAYLTSRVGSQTSLAEIAEAMHVSPSTLSHKYVTEAGRSPLATFHAMRLEAARSLILRGLKLEVVAAQTGFCDAYHLSKAFRQRFAVAPATYRRKLKA
jgi:AraC-like DNA-binding protein